jgi:hypothetical protein
MTTVQNEEDETESTRFEPEVQSAVYRLKARWIKAALTGDPRADEYRDDYAWAAGILG